MWQILLWCHMTTPKCYPLRKREFYKGQNWDINGRYSGKSRFVQLLWAYMAGLDWQTLEKYIHCSTKPVILDLWLASEPCQTIIIKCPCNVADLLCADDNSASAVKHRLRKQSALLNGAWTPWYGLLCKYHKLVMQPHKLSDMPYHSISVMTSQITGKSTVC